MSLADLQAREDEAWKVRVDLLDELLANLQECIDASKIDGGLAHLIALSERNSRLHAAYEVALIDWHQAHLRVMDALGVSS